MAKQVWSSSSLYIGRHILESSIAIITIVGVFETNILHIAEHM
jgi:hypothetical protein